MGFVLVCLGAAFGLACTTLAVFAGFVGPLAAVGVYSGSGALFIIIWAVLTALRPEEGPAHPAVREQESVAIHR